MTIGGDLCVGVMEIMECGLDLDGLSLLGRVKLWGVFPLLSCEKSGSLPSPDPVVGLEVVAALLGISHGERLLTIGDAGGVL